MVSERRRKRIEDLQALTGAKFGVGIAGVLGKALVVPAIIVAFIGGASSAPVLLAMSVLLAVVSFAVWVGAAVYISRGMNASVGSVMWKIWLVATWSFLSDIASL